MRVRTLAVAAALVVAATGCGADDAAPAPVSGPSLGPSLGPSSAEATPHTGAWARATCRHAGLAVRLAVPPGFTRLRDRPCSFARGPVRELTLSLGTRTTLAQVKADDVDPFVDVGGDDSVSDVRYAAGVPVFSGRPGRLRGERLDYLCYCDGQDLHERLAQAAGVRLQWTTPGGRDVQESAYAGVAASLVLRRVR